MQEPVAVTGIHLVKSGAFTLVRAEIDGRWIEVIREHSDGPFSHIVEPGGMRQAARTSQETNMSAEDDRDG